MIENISVKKKKRRNEEIDQLANGRKGELKFVQTMKVKRT